LESFMARVAQDTPETVISDVVAERHDFALGRVLPLLRTSGISAHIVHTLRLQLFGDGRPLPRGDLRRYAPELVAYSEAGWRIATVTVGPRSRCYLVSLPTAGVTSQMVDADRPTVVAEMVLAAAGRSSAIPESDPEISSHPACNPV
jgi:hypothetical protein